MFNLLRRRSRRGKTHKSRFSDASDHDDTNDDDDVNNRERETSTTTRTYNSVENQQQFSAKLRETEREREKMATVHRAVIEELEDFASDDESNVKLATTAANSATSRDTLNINNTGITTTTATIPTVTTTTTVKAAAAGDEDRNVAGRRSRNEAGRAQSATTTTSSVQQQEEPTSIDGLIGGDVVDDGPASRDTVGTVITNAVTYRHQLQSETKSKQIRNQIEQKRQSRLSLTNLGLLHLGNKSHKSHKLIEKEQVEKNQEQEQEKVKEEVTKVKRKALQKSRDFFNDIFMARGRNRHNRNQQQQPPIPPIPQQQQQQQSSEKVKAAAANVISKALATAGPTTLAAAPTHLETNSDPSTATAATSPSSYQMTMSNNSAKNSYRAAATNSHRHHHHHQNHHQQIDEEQSNSNRRRSNSAECEIRTGEQPSNRARSVDPSSSSSREFIHAANVERHGVAVVANGISEDRVDLPGASTTRITTTTTKASDITAMGQTSAKPNEAAPASNTRIDFRESMVTPPRTKVPKITVVDCSSDSEDLSPMKENDEEDIFFELNQPVHEANIEMLPLEEDEVFTADIPQTVYQNGSTTMGRPWTRLSNVKLANVLEEDDEEEIDDDDDNEDGDDDDEVDEAMVLDDDLDERAPTGKAHERKSASSERSALKSDSNLSGSFTDSGIGGSQNDSPHSQQHQQHFHYQHQHHHQQQQPSQPSHPSLPSRIFAASSTLRSPFVRDGNSTDCDETLLQCDDLIEDIDHYGHNNSSGQQFSERLVCIESWQLPDVVVESTTAAVSNGSSSSSSASSTTSAAAAAAAAEESQINININHGASGNNVGNVHFIPIHIEGGASRSRSNSPKQRSYDDSCIGRGVEIVEDGSVLNAPPESPYEMDRLKQELKQQKTRYTSQLDDAQKNVQNLEVKVGDMQTKIQQLEYEMSLKQWNVERLQGELDAARKDDEYVRKRLKLLEDEKTNLRHKYSDTEEEFRRKYDELETQYNELTDKYKQTQSLASSLQTQLANAQVDAEQWRNEVNKIRADLEEQIRILRNALENSEAERKICEDKWQKEFEQLRTHNLEREETLMTDCEWQMRQMQRQCKDKIDKSAYERKQAVAKAEELEMELESRRKESEYLRVCQAQVNSLRGVVTEQENSISMLMQRIENLQSDLELANENLETQIEAVQKIKYKCDNIIYDKERQMIYRIDEVRNEAAAFWENKLYTEMTRLTNELESVYADERRDALDKLQNEHIEELRVLTNRYTSNEEELRAEIEELNGNLELKKQDFLTLRERSDNALLQTRMHLDRADREYQNAMCREEDRRVDLEEKLKKEFCEEKQEMEEKFHERLSQVKEEFAKELQLSTQEMVDQHRKELEIQKAKLQAEKDEAMQQLVERHRAKMAAADERINDTELRHQRNLKDLKAAYDAEKAALDKRDISNANEIEQMHRKCRCLTNLFEEMRMRYERRDPRPEDLREIGELRTRCESQERDLYVLTDRLREMQIQMEELQQNDDDAQQQQRKLGGKTIKKPPPKTIPTNCDVIYEENEERESPETDDSIEENASSNEQEPSDTESNHTVEVNGKRIDCINEDDAHMITTV